VLASCSFVDRLLKVRSQTIQKVQEGHEIPLSYIKEHEMRVFIS